jgi:hypothetical protein
MEWRRRALGGRGRSRVGDVGVVDMEGGGRGGRGAVLDAGGEREIFRAARGMERRRIFRADAGQFEKKGMPNRDGNDSEGIRTPAGRAQWISSPSP